MSPRQFMRWFSREHGRPICASDPTHLVGSYFHRIECEAAESVSPKEHQDGV